MDTTATVTCRTPKCANGGAPIVLIVGGFDMDGNPWTVPGVICGVCNRPITDIEPPLPGPVG